MIGISIQTIFNTLRGAGLTQAGALGVMGNLDCESGCEANRLQGDFSPYRTASKDYTARVSNGSISRDQFAKDSKGYGLAQWTYFSRKYALYDWWQKSGKALDDAQMQTEFLLHELLTDGMYSKLLPILRTSVDTYECTKQFCIIFERPAINNIDARFASAKRLEGQLDLSGSAPAPKPQEPVSPGWELIPATEFWPPRTICKGMKGKDVEVLCALLKARGWGLNYVSDEFGSFVDGKVREFQTAYHLDVDGIVGNQTWTKLLER